MYEDLLAQRLYHLRELKGVSAREMSLSLGQNSSYINRIENKIAMPSVQNLFYICEYLQVSPAEFFSAENKNPALIHELTGKMEKLTAKQLSIIKEIIDSYLEPNK